LQTAAGRRIGVDLTNHMNRRTGLRACWLAGVPLETIRDLAGHEDTKTTSLYIGVNMDDKSGAMSQLAKYQSALARANLEGASVGSGRTGIITRRDHLAPTQIFLDKFLAQGVAAERLRQAQAAGELVIITSAEANYPSHSYDPDHLGNSPFVSAWDLYVELISHCPSVAKDCFSQVGKCSETNVCATPFEPLEAGKSESVLAGRYDYGQIREDGSG